MARGTFELRPVLPFRLDLAVWTLRRRPGNIVDRWDGTTYRRVLPLTQGPVEVAISHHGRPAAGLLHVAVAGQPVRAAVRAAVTSALERLLGLSINLAGFYKFAAHHRRLSPLARRFRGMKPPRFPTVFEGVINAIACQQMTLTLGIRLLSDLAVAFGPAFDNGDETVYAFPRPADLAGLNPPDLRRLGFSHQKGKAMIELARSITEGHLDLERFAELSDDEAVKQLCELRGVGRWTAEYVLLRGLGRTHVFPADDVGARNNLRRWLGITRPLDYESIREQLSPFGQYAGLVYFHLLLDRLSEAGELDASDTTAKARKGVVHPAK